MSTNIHLQLVTFGLLHNLEALVFYQGPGGATARFEQISYWVNVMKTADYVAQTAIGDGILVSHIKLPLCKTVYLPACISDISLICDL